MPKEISSDIVGSSLPPVPIEWTPFDTQLYAVAVGADPWDDNDLNYIYEGRGPKVLPTYPVVKVLSIMGGIMSQITFNPAMILHGEQSIKVHGPLPNTFKGEAKGTVSQVWDKGKAAVIGVKSVVEQDDGTPLVELELSLFIGGAGGFGGERGPSSAETAVQLPDRAPDFVLEETVAQNQAAIYRLCGDRMPLHIDPEFAKLGGHPKPFLHGLCTYSIAGRHIIKALCGGDETRFVSMTGRFAKQVWMGDQVITKMWDEGNGKAICQVENQNGDIVISNCVVEYKPA